MRQGDELLVLGFARPDVIAGQPTLGRGLLSGLRRDADGRLWVQTDAPMNHGDSGGAVVNMRGKLVGVVSFGIADVMRSSDGTTSSGSRARSARKFTICSGWHSNVTVA